MSEAAKAEKKSLATKLAEVMGEVERIAKNGRNEFHKYDYATEADITAAVRQHMAERHLIMVPSVKDTQWTEGAVTKSGSKNKLCTLTVEFTVMDGDTGQEMKFTVLGQGEDTGDKATYKAMTGALKYALLKLFMIPTGDDPENDTEHRFAPPRQPAPANSDAPPSPQPAPRAKSSGGLTAKFGSAKGKTPAEMSDKDLAWYMDAATKAVKANDPKWHKSNLAWLTALQAEAQTRISATGKIQAPAATSPRQAELAPVEDEGEEIVTPQMRFFQLARESNLSPAQLTSRAKGVLGKTSGFTHGDIETLRASIVAVPG